MGAILQQTTINLYIKTIYCIKLNSVKILV